MHTKAKNVKLFLIDSLTNFGGDNAIKPKYKISKVFIASLDPETGEWTKHKYQKKTDKQINLEHWLSKGFTTWDKCMQDDKAYSISESQWHNLMKQLKEDKRNA